jgi:FkbM family methyltransferase
MFDIDSVWVRNEDGSKKIDEAPDDAILMAKPFLPQAPVILEAGASSGEHTLLFKRKWPDCIVFCFEPNSELYNKHLERTKNIHGIRLFPFALSNKTKRCKFYIGEAAETSSLLLDNIGNIIIPEDVRKSVNMPAEYKQSYNDREGLKSCLTINRMALAYGIDKVNYLWLDTEGSELDILSEATNILPSVKVISIELNFQMFRVGTAQAQDVISFLIEHGFTFKYFWGRTNWQGTGIFINESAI